MLTTEYPAVPLKMHFIQFSVVFIALHSAYILLKFTFPNFNFLFFITDVFPALIASSYASFHFVKRNQRAPTKPEAQKLLHQCLWVVAAINLVHVAQSVYLTLRDGLPDGLPVQGLMITSAGMYIILTLLAFWSMIVGFGWVSRAFARRYAQKPGMADA